MVAPSGFVVVWGCFCSDAADDPTELATHCPGHKRPVIGELVENMRDGPVRTGHACRETQCTAPDTHHTTDHASQGETK